MGIRKSIQLFFLVNLNRHYNSLFRLRLGFNPMESYEISNIILPLQPQ